MLTSPSKLGLVKSLPILCALLVQSACTDDAVGPPVFGNGDPDPRPNIVMVVADDMRWDLLSGKGHEFLSTPHLDTLLNEGATMNNAFVPVALCSPSRGAILTGREAHKASAPRIAWRNNSFLQTQRTFAEELQAAGYTTAYVGKWHMGDGHLPKRGFDHWESFDWLGKFFNPTVFINGERKEYTGYVDDILADRAKKVIEYYGHPSKPLFLMVGLKAPHMQFEYPDRHEHALDTVTIPKPDSYDEDFIETGKLSELKEWLGMDNFHCGLNCFDDSWDKYIKSHYRAVLSLDDSIGTIRGGVKAGAKADNTLFIYTSDNGYSLGDHGLTEKHLVYEEPIRVPMLIDAPGDNDAGISTTELVNTIDLAPTILDYAGVEIPQRMTGRSLRPLLGDEAMTAVAWRDQLFFMYEKLQIAVRTADHKLIKSLTNEGHFELYDLVNDPKETQSVYNQPQQVVIQQNMRRRLKSIVHENDWSPRKVYPVSKVLVSNPVTTTRAAEFAELASRSAIDSESKLALAGQTLQWQELLAGAGPNADRFMLSAPVENSEGLSVLVAIPLDLLVDWDPFVEVKIRRRTHATMYIAGTELWNNTGGFLPMNFANPPLVQGANQVILRFDDSAAMDVLLELESPANTLVLPLEDRVLGDSPGRFKHVDSWQPHDASILVGTAGKLVWTSTAGNSQIQSQNLYFNETVNLTLRYKTSGNVDLKVTWLSEDTRDQDDPGLGVQLQGSGEFVEKNITVYPSTEVDEIRFELQQANATIEFDRISISSLNGSVLHNWDF